MESSTGSSASKSADLSCLGRSRIASIMALLAYVSGGSERLDDVGGTFCCLHSAHAVFFRADLGRVCWWWVRFILAVWLKLLSSTVCLDTTE